MQVHDEFAFEMAKNFMYRVTSTEPTRILELDQKKNRARPDFHFHYPNGKHYIIEVTRWIDPKLRGLEDFLNRLFNPLTQILNGTFAVYIPYDKLEGGRVSKIQARGLFSEIKQVISSNTGQARHPLTMGEIYKVRDEGKKLVPVICASELPPYLDMSDREVKTLRDILIRDLDESERKFSRYRHSRVLLLDMSQSTLDIENHAGISSEGPGIIRRWVGQLLKPSTGIDYVSLHQFRIWRTFGRMLTGHRHVDRSSPYYTDVWHKPGLPHILQTYNS